MRELVSLKYFLDDEGARVLDRLARDFPVELRRALKGVGFQLKLNVQGAIRDGGPPGRKWEKLSTIHQYQRLTWLKKAGAHHNSYYYDRLSLKKVSAANKHAALVGGHYMTDVKNRWRGRTAKGTLPRGVYPMGRMLGGIRYKMEKSGNGVLIGGLNPSMDRYLRSVQMGGALQGQNKYPSHVGTQTITPAMRRLFFAAGIPLKKGRRSITMPPRPLIRPVFEAHAQHVVNYLQLAVKNYVEGGTLTRDSMAQQAGFRPSFS